MPCFIMKKKMTVSIKLGKVKKSGEKVKSKLGEGVIACEAFAKHGII